MKELFEGLKTNLQLILNSDKVQRAVHKVMDKELVKTDPTKQQEKPIALTSLITPQTGSLELVEYVDIDNKDGSVKNHEIFKCIDVSYASAVPRQRLT